MIDINTWIDLFVDALEYTFAERVLFVGLQGSYGRGEATEKSDIDVVVILDELTCEDIKKYNRMLDTLPNRELICGFISGRDDIGNWEKSDLFQFYHDTVSIKGSLDELIPTIDSVDVERAIKIGACNIFHGCVHNMLHEKSEDILRGLYKSAYFVIQANCFKLSGEYVRSAKELLEAVEPYDKGMINNFLILKNGGEIDFEIMSDQLFEWSKKTMKNRI